MRICYRVCNRVICNKIIAKINYLYLIELEIYLRIIAKYIYYISSRKTFTEKKYFLFSINDIKYYIFSNLYINQI